jgi:group I intron endonuclease
MEEIADRYVIYRYTSPSGKSYIGQTKDIKQRSRSHRKCSSGCLAFADAIKRYGWSAFTLDILFENLTIDMANLMEQECIAKYNTLAPYGYNLHSGGKNFTASDLSKDKKRGKNNPMFGRTGAAHPNFGKTPTDATKQLLREANSGDRSGNYGKVGAANPTSRSFRVVFPDGTTKDIVGMLNFCKEYGLNNAHMIQVAKGNSLQHKGFKCSYL